MGKNTREMGNGRGPKSKREGQEYVFTSIEGAELLLQLCLGAAMSGGAVRIGLTRDMGAVAIGMYKGDDYATEYVRPGEDLAAEVRAIASAWDVPLAAWDEDNHRWILI